MQWLHPQRLVVEDMTCASAAVIAVPWKSPAVVEAGNGIVGHSALHTRHLRLLYAMFRVVVRIVIGRDGRDTRGEAGPSLEVPSLVSLSSRHQISRECPKSAAPPDEGKDNRKRREVVQAN